MRIDVVTIFPEYFAPLELSLIGKARARGLVELRVTDLRRFADDPHRSVDDAPFGGGPGMVMRPEPWGRALDELAGSAADRAQLLLPAPAGRPLTQALVARYAVRPWLVIGCGRYEGVDARVLEYARRSMDVDEVSIGDYVVAGGEVAGLVLIEAITRLLPRVVGNDSSLHDDSFAGGRPVLEGPVYTRPASWRGLDVPEVLLSGDHAAVAAWRREESRRRTAAMRPDLLRAEDLPTTELPPVSP
jgi:tRNA (guanine37-N1)-methyltransferase